MYPVPSGGTGNRGRGMLRVFDPRPTGGLMLTRHLDSQGLQFTILNRAQYDESAFAGVCMAFGCESRTAYRVARELSATGERKTTVRPINGFEALKKACRFLGVHVETIEPHPTAGRVTDEPT